MIALDESSTQAIKKVQADILDAQIAEMKNTIEDQEAVVEKFKTASETITNNIQEGLLSETDKLSVIAALGKNTGAEFLSNWSQAGDATERAALAAQLTSQYMLKFDSHYIQLNILGTHFHPFL